IYLDLQGTNALRRTMEEDDTTTPNNPPVDNDLVENYDVEQADNNTWIPTDEMLNFTTTIYKDNLLSKFTRAEILKEQPRNAQIKYEAPHMDKRIWKLMSPQAKETDKLLSKVAYCSLAMLHPLDNTLRAIYYAKPDTNSEALQQSLKVISPNYIPSLEREEVFGDDLNSIIKRENATNKLFNKAADNHKKQHQNYKGNVSRPTYVKRAITTFPTIVFKDSETCFGVATTMGVAQGHTATTRTQCSIKERANSSNREFVSPFAKLVSANRTFMAHTYYQRGLLPGMAYNSSSQYFPLDQYHIVPLKLSGKI
ncbi:30005_t:CDS:2, partial [Gigaspora margarita]